MNQKPTDCERYIYDDHWSFATKWICRKNKEKLRKKWLNIPSVFHSTIFSLLYLLKRRTAMIQMVETNIQCFLQSISIDEFLKCTLNHANQYWYIIKKCLIILLFFNWKINERTKSFHLQKNDKCLMFYQSKMLPRVLSRETRFDCIHLVFRSWPQSQLLVRPKSNPNQLKVNFSLWLRWTENLNSTKI